MQLLIAFFVNSQLEGISFLSNNIELNFLGLHTFTMLLWYYMEQSYIFMTFPDQYSFITDNSIREDLVTEVKHLLLNIISLGLALTLSIYLFLFLFIHFFCQFVLFCFVSLVFSLNLFLRFKVSFANVLVTNSCVVVKQVAVYGEKL